MIKHNQDGAISGLLVSLILCVILLFGAMGFAYWAYAGRQDYKNNVDAKVKVAQEATREQVSQEKDRQFAEEAKKPLKTYTGPAAMGSLIVNYPKTWSSYVEDTGAGNSNTLQGYFSPSTVPSTKDSNATFALRIQVDSQPYSQSLQSIVSQQSSGKITISAYSLPKMPNVVGVKVSGEIPGLAPSGKTVTLVMLPLRSQTLKVWTDGSQNLNDFNNNILPNLSFTP